MIIYNKIMKMAYRGIAILAYFFTGTPNQQVLRGKEKYSLHTFYEKIEK